MKLNKTYFPQNNKIERKCFIIDADDKILGRVAAKAATILRGKNKTIFTPHVDTGDNVIIINAAKVRVSGKKAVDKFYTDYSGYPSGLKITTFENLLKKSPVRVMALAVKCMLARGPIGFHARSRLRVYAGDKHPHQAQKPIPVSI
jgi:large subunit ribosomal protein L13